MPMMSMQMMRMMMTTTMIVVVMTTTPAFASVLRPPGACLYHSPAYSFLERLCAT